MADISKITTPSGDEYNLKDAEGRAQLAADPNKVLIVAADSSGTYDYTMTLNTSGTTLINLAEEEY